MIATLDHVGYAAADGDGLRSTFARLGFSTTEPHEILLAEGDPAAEGGGLRPLPERSSLAVLKAGYLELTAMEGVGALPPACRLICFGVDDLEAAYASCVGNGVQVRAPSYGVRRMRAGRRHGDVRFDWFMLEKDETPEGAVCFMRHHAAELIYPEAAAQHANGALGLDEVCIVTDDLPASSARYARILGIEPARSSGEALIRLLRGAVRICERARFDALHGSALGVASDRFGLVALRVRDLAAASRTLQANRVPYRAAQGAAYVSAAHAAGAALALRRGR